MILSGNIFRVGIVLVSVLNSGTFTSLISTPYSSEFLESGSKRNIKAYHSKQLNELSKAVKPRVIHYIASENYRKYGSIHVTGVLFTYQDEEARKVMFISSMDNFQRHPMTRNARGVWYHILPSKPYQLEAAQSKVRYQFLVDGSFETDAHGEIETSADGNRVSVYRFDPLDFKPGYGVLFSRGGPSYSQEVTFRVKIPSADEVSLIGNFNHWNHELDIMKKVAENVFEIRKKLPKGKYIYLYRTLGEYYMDEANIQKKFHPVYGRVSYFEVK